MPFAPVNPLCLPTRPSKETIQEVWNTAYEFANKKVGRRCFLSMLSQIEKENMTSSLEVMNERNTTDKDMVVYFYKNLHNKDEYQGPFYFEISGKNKSSFKVKSIDKFGNSCEIHKIIQIKRDGTQYNKNIRSLSFKRTGGDYTVYKVSLENISNRTVNPLLNSIE